MNKPKPMCGQTRTEMRCAFVQCETPEEAEAAYPWADLIDRVEGGFMCFESETDHAAWLALR